MTQTSSQRSGLVGKRLGILLPSSNTVVEPLAARMLAGTGVSAHFSRLGVIDVALGGSSQAQFELRRHVDAAVLLADAKVDAIVWGGTSASWLGTAHDEAFVEAVQAETGIPTTSCVFAMNAQIQASAGLKLGLVTPYTNDVHLKVIENYKSLGIECVASSHFGGALSHDFADIIPEAIDGAVRSVAAFRPDMIFIMCTNLAGASVAERLSEDLGIPIVDSAAATLKAGLNCLQAAPQ